MTEASAGGEYRPAAPLAHALDPQPELALKGQHLDASVPPADPQAVDMPTAFVPYSAPRELSTHDFGRPHRRGRLSLFLFVVTCLSTFWVAVANWSPLETVDSVDVAMRLIAQHWDRGLIYMAGVMGILLMHEMGHFVQTLRYRVPATWPLFLPLPIMPTGTMGAVIGMDGSNADRKQLFDIGLSGPWAGLLAAIPLLCIGVWRASADPTLQDPRFGTPLIFDVLIGLLRPGDLPSGVVIRDPLFMAGWVGMLVTGLNMLPVSQLDGGHVVYGLFGPQAKWVARAFIIAAIIFIVSTEQYNWVIMLVLVIMLGVDHPPTRNDHVPLGATRWIIGLVSLLIPVFCFTPLIIPGS